MQNLLDIQNALRSAPDQQLMGLMQGSNPMVPQWAVASELNNRKEMRSEQTRQEGLGQPTVIAQLTGNVMPTPAPAPQTNVAGMPQGAASGMAQSIAPKTDTNQNTGIASIAKAAAPVATMASGGILKMAGAGEVESGFLILNTPPITKFGEVVAVSASTLEKITDKYPDIMAQANSKELVVPTGSEKGQNIANRYKGRPPTEIGYSALVGRVDETEPNQLDAIQRNAKDTVAKIRAEGIVVATEPTPFMDLDTVDTPGETDRIMRDGIKNTIGKSLFSPNRTQTKRATELEPIPIYADDNSVYNDNDFNEKLRGIPSVIKDARTDGNVLQGPAERAGDYLGAMSGVQAGVDARQRAEKDRNTAKQKRGLMTIADTQAAEVDRQAAEEKALAAAQGPAERAGDYLGAMSEVQAGVDDRANKRQEEIERKRRISAQNVNERADESAAPMVDRFPPLSRAELGAMGSNAAEAYLQNMRGERGSVTGYNEVMLPQERAMLKQQRDYRKTISDQGYGYGDGPDKQADENIRESIDFMANMRSREGEYAPFEYAYRGDGLKPSFTDTDPISYKGLDRFEKPDARETRAGIAAYSPSANPSILDTPISLEYIQNNPELFNEYMIELRKEHADDPALANKAFKERLAAEKAKTNVFAANKTAASDADNTPAFTTTVGGPHVGVDGEPAIKTGDSRAAILKDMLVAKAPGAFDTVIGGALSGTTNTLQFIADQLKDAGVNPYGSDSNDPKVSKDTSLAGSIDAAVNTGAPANVATPAKDKDTGIVTVRPMSTSGLSRANAVGGYEQKLLDILDKREKSADQDKWLGLAEMGMRLMSSTNPNPLAAIGESGLGAFGSYVGQKKERDAEELNVLGKLADMDMAKQTLQARKDIAAAGRSSKNGFTFSQAVNTQQERAKLVNKQLADMRDPLGGRLEGIDREIYDKKVNEAAAINADLQRLYAKGNLGSSRELATALENVQVDSTT